MKSGIYKITNTINNKFYIGSAVNLNARRTTHFSTLRCKRHRNRYLQKSWNKYGENNFEFEVLCKCPKEYLIKLEQWFIDNLKPQYNLAKIAGSTLGTKQPNKFSLETKKLFSELRKGKKRGKYKTHKILESYQDYKIYVKNMDNNIIIYDSYDDCSNSLNIPKSTIKNALKRGNKVYNKYLFSYTDSFSDTSKYKSNPHKS